MKVVLLKNLPELGNLGEIKEVKKGYALNYLLPNKLAGIPGQVVIKRTSIKSNQPVKKIDPNKYKEKLNNLTLKFNQAASDKGTLYEAIGKKDIESALNKQGVKISVHDLNPPHIKTVGEHPVTITIAEGHKFKIKLIINSK